MLVSIAIFAATELTPEAVRGKQIVEVGSSEYGLRSLLTHWGPARYVGVDISPGPGVDVVCPAEQAADRLGRDSFDLVICTETLEHIRDWRAAVRNLKALCRQGGLLLVTAPSRGYPYHGAPFDYWRYELDDLRAIFDDCEVVAIQRDPVRGGSLLLARKPSGFRERDVSQVALFSIIHGQRRRSIEEKDLHSLRFYRVSLGAEFRHGVGELLHPFIRRVVRKKRIEDR